MRGENKTTPAPKKKRIYKEKRSEKDMGMHATMREKLVRHTRARPEANASQGHAKDEGGTKKEMKQDKRKSGIGSGGGTAEGWEGE